MAQTTLYSTHEQIKFDYSDQIRPLITAPGWSSICNFCLTEVCYSLNDRVVALCSCLPLPRVAHEACVQFQERLRMKKKGDVFFSCEACNIIVTFNRHLFSKKAIKPFTAFCSFCWRNFACIIYIFGYFNYCKSLGKMSLIFNPELSIDNFKGIFAKKIVDKIKPSPFLLDTMKNLHAFFLGFGISIHVNWVLFSELMPVIVSILLLIFLYQNNTTFFIINLLYEFIFLITADIIKGRLFTEDLSIEIRSLNTRTRYKHMFKMLMQGIFKFCFIILIKYIVEFIEFTVIHRVLLFLILIQLYCVFVMRCRAKHRVQKNKVVICPSIE
ncbi:hypothetical protein CDIK_0004 [Cucumispora dikerogammari]|nr:hypothetical protein CDIK_0004 [Cucumispora dikerogammari]